MSRRNQPGTVYSSEHGRICRLCGRPQKACICRANPRKTAAPNAEGDGIVRVSRSSKGRGGKTVTIISGIPGTGDELKALARALKQHCGTGGAVKEGDIEIQGDQRDALIAELSARGYQVRRSGG